MLYKTLSAAVYGIDANIIEVEVDISGIKTNEDHFHTVGLPDAAVRESRDRVRAALKNCGYDIPLTHISPLLISARKVRVLICRWRLEFSGLMVD
jgi:magnesium chelatase family protein